MSFRLIIHIPRRTIKLLLYTAVGIAVLFLALTRTQVGRDGLRTQIERQFNNTFEGQLQIGQLQGNLLNTLYAHNIQLMDSAGVLVAAIDAAVLQPTWTELLTGTVSLQRITLIQPEFSVLLKEDGTWNISDVFKRHRSIPNAPKPSAFTSSNIKIMDGTLHTSNKGVLPADVEAGKVFNYADAVVSDIQAQLNVEWLADSKLLDIDQLSLKLDGEDIELADVHGQFFLDNDRIEFNEVFVQANNNWLAFSGSVDQFVSLDSLSGNTTIDFDISKSRLDADMLKQLFPTLPIADTLQITSRISGPLNALDIQNFAIERGDLRINGNGYVRGFPDSLAFIAYLDDSKISQTDIKRVFPTLDVSVVSPEFNPLIKSLQARGAVLLNDKTLQSPHYGKLSFELENEGKDGAGLGGGVAGSFEFTQTKTEDPLVFNAFLETDSLNLNSVLPNFEPITMLNGTAAIKGAGENLENLITDVQLRLSQSSLAGVGIDTLETYAFFENGTVDVQSSLRHRQHGAVGANAVLDYASPSKTLNAEFRIARFDIGSIIKHDSLQTNLAASIRLDAQGSTLEDLRGTMQAAVDNSELALGDLQQQIPQHEFSLAFIDTDENQQALTLDGDIATASLTGNFNLASFSKMASNWGKVIDTTIREIVSKPALSTDQTAANQIAINQTATNPTSLDPTATGPSAGELILVEQAPPTESAVQSADSVDVPSGSFKLDLALHNPDLIRSWFPTAPYMASDAIGSFQLSSSPDALSITGEITADSLIIDDVATKQLLANLAFSADLAEPATSRALLKTTLNADSLQLFGQIFPQPVITVDIADGVGDLHLATKSTLRQGPQRIQTHIEILPDRNRVHFEELFLSVGNSSWIAYAQPQIDVIGKQVTIPGLELQSRSPEANILQTVHLSGVLSPNPSDTAAIDINNITIRPISQFLEMQKPLGGLISGQLAFTTTADQPEITGSIKIDRFSLDNRVLGDINIASRYLPGQPDVGLQIGLTPIASFNQEQFLPDADIPAIYEDNELSIDGTFRLPKLNEESTGFLDAGSLDLDLNLYRADAFFFEYIFPNFLGRADGYLTGGGTISGNFDFPVFNTELEIRDGEIDIPKFNLQYSGLNGSLYVDERAIRLENGLFTDPTGGVARFEGDFLFNDYRYFSFDLTGQVDELLIMNQDYLAEDLPFYGQIWASGSLTLTGPAFNATLISNDAVTKASSELFIPVTEDDVDSDVGFLIFADSTGQIPDINQLSYRKNLLSKRPEGERKFADGLSLDLNIFAPSGSTVHLVFDPLLGDAMNAVSSGRIQIQRKDGKFSTFGTLNVESGDYLFTAGDVFARRFIIDRGGTITWDGDPIDARLKIPASYRTRASVAGLGLQETAYSGDNIPLIVQLDISGRVSTPEVALSLKTDRSDRSYRGNYEAIEAVLNQSERLTDYATSVLLTNSFLLTTETATNSGTLTNSGNQIAFTSVSQLVASQLNRFLGEALPNVDLNLGLQGQSLEDPEVTYGVALYLLDQRLVIRGQGVYQNEISNQPDLEGEFEVEVRLSPSVSVSVFLRREGDLSAQNALTSTRGAGLSYQTQFSSWKRLFHRIFKKSEKEKENPTPPDDRVAISPNE